MATFQLPYGHSVRPLVIPDSIAVDVITPLDVPPAPNPTALILHALKNPLGGFRFEDFSSARSAAIAINDKTRPVAHEILLPPLLEQLERTGIPRENIELIVATGTHAPMPADEFDRILPQEILTRYRVTSHDCDDPSNLTGLGVTARGTPVSINRRFLSAGLRIAVGNIEPHHFMGFSGGVKNVSIGLAGRATINANHAMLPDPNARVGLFEDNPMRMDVEEIGRMAGVHLALNTIPNMEKQIIHVLAGDPQAVMQAGVALSLKVCQVEVDAPYDLVIASPGGYPKDINLYQSQKALTHGSLITRDGGIVILAAECIEGAGSPSFEAFVGDLNSSEEVFAKFKRLGFQVGPHKAFQIALIAGRVQIGLVSELPAENARRFFFTPAASLQEAFESVLAALPSNPRVAILPGATHTIPMLRRSEPV